MGTPGNDTIFGDIGGEYISGDGGDDLLVSNYYGGVTLDGGEGDDQLAAGSDDARGSVLLGGAGNDFLSTIQSSGYLYGGDGNDSFSANGYYNHMYGGSGDDGFFLGGFANYASGGDGNDTFRVYYELDQTLDGGDGTDLLILSGPAKDYTFGTLGAALTIQQVGENTQTLSVSNVELVQFGSAPPVSTASLLPCYLQGTKVLTEHGEVAVEDLQPGLKVVTVSGRHDGLSEVVWVGHRRVDLRRHPKPTAINPIRIHAGALADGIPTRDLLVSPGHCLWIDGKLIPAKMLMNGTSIVQETHHAEVTYWHVELANHDVMLAEGAPAESYFDTGNRHAFENGVVKQLHPDFTHDDGRPDAQRLVPRLTPDDDRAVENIWQDLASRALWLMEGAIQAVA